MGHRLQEFLALDRILDLDERQVTGNSSKMMQFLMSRLQASAISWSSFGLQKFARIAD
jgi:hypothetical protein